MEDATAELTRIELMLRVMKNIERNIMINGNRSEVARERANSPNWVMVKNYLTAGTSKGGSGSAHEQCRLMGVDPDGMSFYKD